MKSFLFVSLITIFCIRHVVCFLTYPISSHILHEFLDTLNASKINIEKDLLSHAVPGENCIRECSENDRKICYFNFTLKHYQTLGG